MPIDIFDPVTMAAVVRQLPETPRFLKDTFFSRDQLEPTVKVAFDVFKGMRRVAPYVSIRNKTPVAEKIGYRTNSVDTPLVAIKDVTDIEDVMKRLPGEVLMGSGMTPADRGLELMAQVLNDFNAQIARREEVMCAQALFDGVIHVTGPDIQDYDIDFGLTNKGTASVLWDAESSTANPIEDLQGWVNQCIQNGYRTPDICIMSQNAYDAFRDRMIALGYLDQWHMNVMEMAPQVHTDGVYWVGRLRQPNLDIYVYTNWYLDDWTDPDAPTEKQVIPTGKILIGSRNMRSTMFYGVLSYADRMTSSWVSPMVPRGADSWVEKDPDVRFLRMQSRPLPVPQEIDSWYAATVASTT